MNYLGEVFEQTADGGYFDFARCQRKNGTIYGSPTGTCRKGTLIPDEVEVKKTPTGGSQKMRLTAKIKAMSSAELQKVVDDPRLSASQRTNISRLIKVRKAEEGSAAAKIARPPDPKVAAKVNKAMAKKNEEAQKKEREDIANEVMTNKKFKSDKARIAEMVRRGVPANTDFVALVADAKARRGQDEAKQNQIEENKKTQVGRSVQQEMERQMLRGEVKLDRNALAFNPTYQGKTLESLSTLRNSYNTMKVLMKDPSFQTNANRARLINTRIAIWRTEKALRESVSAKQIDPKTYASTLKQSPKYDKTPGSTKPLGKAKSEDIGALEKQIKGLSAKLDNKSLTTMERFTISEEMLDINRRMRVARGDSPPASPNLKKIYEDQGFNAKPELVGTAADLRTRKDLLVNADGSNVVLYRGVTTEEFGNQFKGLGEGGGQHFAGRGIYGNGSYAAAGDFNNPKGSEMAAQATAAAYSGERKNLAAKVTAFGLRKDSNVVTHKGKDFNERTRSYDSWFDRTISEAQEKTGYRFTDVGEAAAALGIHAYQVPQRDQDFFVVLNRGAVVAAMDSQFSDSTGLR